MAVTIHIHPDLCYLTGHQEVAEVEGKTVRECLDRLIERYPAVGEFIFYKEGGLQTFIELYVNRSPLPPNELTRSVRGGDDIHLVLALLAGG